MPVDVTKTQARWGEPTDFHIVGSDASRRRLRRRRPGHERRRSATGSSCTPGQWDPDDPWVMAGQGPRARGQLPRVGLRHVLGLVRAVHARCRRTSACRRPTSSPGRRPPPPRSPAPPPTACSSAGPRTPCSPATSCSSGAAQRRARLARDPARRERRRARRRGREQRREGRVREELGAVGYINRKDFSHWGVPPTWDSPEWKDWFDGREGVRQGDLGRARREGVARASSSSIRARTRSRRRSSSATAAAWS